MYKIKLSKSKRSTIQAKKRSTKDQRMFRRLQCVELAAKHEPHREIADTLGVSVDTVTDWLTLYRTKGLQGLCAPISFDRRKSILDPHIGDIKQFTKEKIVSNLSELQAALKTKFSIEVEQSWLYRCCKKNAICLTKRPV